MFGQTTFQTTVQTNSCGLDDQADDGDGHQAGLAAGDLPGFHGGDGHAT
jgi:hypothetical protein